MLVPLSRLDYSRDWAPTICSTKGDTNVGSSFGLLFVFVVLIDQCLETRKVVEFVDMVDLNDSFGAKSRLVVERNVKNRKQRTRFLLLLSRENPQSLFGWDKRLF